MTLTLLKAKIHRAVVTQADLHYVGSVTIDETLMKKAGIVAYEKVLVADVDNGKRFETYVIVGKADSGIICINGAAAHCVEVGDRVIIMAFAGMTPEEAETHRPKVVFVDEKNRAIETADCEKHSWNVDGRND
ncbi:MAG: aspartate 1-decarboxylase [Bacteroidales bacterium]|nr:aspartate 1-decarboxylase [Bacteroidales bacterium]